MFINTHETFLLTTINKLNNKTLLTGVRLLTYVFCYLGIVSGQYPLEESGGPLSQMNDAVNNIDRPKNSNDDGHHSMNVKVSNVSMSRKVWPLSHRDLTESTKATFGN